VSNPTTRGGTPYHKDMVIGAVLAILAQVDDPSLYRFPSEARRVESTGERTAGERPWLGITPGVAHEEGGMTVGEVEADGPAARAGLRAGDRILRFGDEEIGDFDALSRALSKRRPGERVRLVADREGESLDLEIVLGRRPGGRENGLTIWKTSSFRLGVILLEFSDGRHNPAFARKDFERMLFSRGEYVGRSPSGERVYGSLADYYAENSGGRFAVSGRVFDWVTLEQPREYFEEKSMGDREARKRLLSRALELVRERDGKECLDDLDGLVFLYAGRQSYLRPKLLWPHRANQRVGNRSLPYYLTAEGGRYFNALNVHVHEFGHMLGLPDQYGKKHATGIGKWCTMAVGHMGAGESGPHRPFHLCVWCKERLGWTSVTTISPKEAQRLKLSAVEKDGSMVFRVLLTPDGSDALLLENRQRVGFDTDLEGTGLLLWRVRRGAPPDLVEAHGRSVPEASLVEPEEIPWPSLYNRDFTPTTDPASPSGVFITDIVLSEGVAYFKVGFPKEGKSRELEKRKDY